MEIKGCVAQLVEQRSPKSPVGGSNPSALGLTLKRGKARPTGLGVNENKEQGIYECL